MKAAMCIVYAFPFPNPKQAVLWLLIMDGCGLYVKSFWLVVLLQVG